MDSYPMFKRCWDHQPNNPMNRHEDNEINCLLHAEGLISSERLETGIVRFTEERETRETIPLETEGEASRVFHELLEYRREGP